MDEEKRKEKKEKKEDDGCFVWMAERVSALGRCW